jgi:hypothetical protein
MRTEESERLPAGRVESFVALLRGIDDLTVSLAKEIAMEPGVVPIRRIRVSVIRSASRKLALRNLISHSLG